MTPAILMENLSKTFGWRKQVQAVCGLNLEVPKGVVYGFLGQNGAGKTTSIRMVLDLIRPTTGEVRLFGQAVQQNRAVLSRVGAQVEGANFYPFLTGRRNLEVLALTSNLQLQKADFDRLLSRVGMLDRADRPVKGYSTGMKQRLGLAATLLSDPDLIILDEPTNGLDPQGIQDIRLFVRRLVDEFGKTVFLSSHLLGEVEQVCDRVAIVHQGELVREGRVSELVGGEARLRIRAEPLETAQQCLSEHWTIEREESGTLILKTPPEDTPQIVEKLVSAGLKVYEVAHKHQTLEEIFLIATEGQSDGRQRSIY